MKSPKTPLVSFILPVYNAADFLTETLHSIIEQTYTNFEVIAINDGSSDNSLLILEHYAKFDERIKVVNQENHGLVYTLNKAIGLAKGTYLARIDADDLCTPRRLEWQVAAMEKNPSAVICAGAYELVDEDGTCLGLNVVPTRSQDIKLLAYTRNPIAHASVMLRKSMLDTDPYSSNVGPTEDYELWSRLILSHEIIAIPHVIMRYRINSGGIMHTIGHQQWKYMNMHFDEYWKEQGLPPVQSPKEVRAMMKYYLKSHTSYGYDVLMFLVVLDGMTQAAAKSIKRGHVIHGVKILIGVALSSRSGLRAVLRRVSLIIKGKGDALFSSQKQSPLPDGE